MNIVNLTPHPVTIIRSVPDPVGSPADRTEIRVEYTACKPDQLPRATEGPVASLTLGLLPDLPGDDTQGMYAQAIALAETGLVDAIGYVGVEGLPEPDHRTYEAPQTTYIVSIVTAIGALAAGRYLGDLLVPCGQVRDATGRVIGATGLASAERLLTPMALWLRARR